MGTRHVSFRIDSGVYERLERRSQQAQRKRPELMNAYIDEGLRMEEHPGIVFRSGPAGRRAALCEGPDVWEVVRVVKNVEARDEQAVSQAADWLGLRRGLVDAAIRYYAEHRAEVDAWIARQEAEAERVRDALERRRRALA